MTHVTDSEMTLDPPGTIAVVGAGVLGIEAALYGRFLGYNVTLLEGHAVGHSMRDCQDDPLPMLPDRCLSPLAISALATQSENSQQVLPMTYGQWIDDALVPLVHSDLLAGRLQVPAQVTNITTVPVQPEQPDEDIADIPADFRLKIAGGDTIDAEAVVLAIGTSPSMDVDFPLPAPYFFRIGERRSEDLERDLHAGLRQIVDLYAGLAGRSDLDLYRPKRM